MDCLTCDAVGTTLGSLEGDGCVGLTLGRGGASILGSPARICGWGMGTIALVSCRSGGVDDGSGGENSCASRSSCFLVSVSFGGSRVE